MAEFDFLGKPKKVTVTTSYDQNELYQYLQNWFSERHYDVGEKDYNERISSDGKKKINFNWWMEKKAELLTKLVMELSFDSESQESQVTGTDGTIKSVQKGTITVSIRAFVYRDAESDWQLKREFPEKRLIRELYARIIKKPRLMKYQDQLNSDWNSVVADLKMYLNTHKFN
jgi:hypothetical protein